MPIIPQRQRRLLADAGYPHGFKTNIVTEGTQNLALLQIIKGYFSAVGIDMEIRPMESADWVAFCRTSRKYDQMVNRHGAGALGMVSEPLNHLERFRKGFPANYSMVDDPVFESFYNRALSVTVSMNLSKSSEMPMNMLPGSTSRYLWCSRICSDLPNRGSKATAANSARKPTIMSYCHFIWGGFGLDRNLKKSSGQK